MRSAWAFGWACGAMWALAVLSLVVPAATSENEEPSPTSESPPFCAVLTERLDVCAGCSDSVRREADRARATCRSGCPELTTTARRPVVLPSLVAVELDTPRADVAKQCAAGGGTWMPASPASAATCTHARGPWGLAVDWSVTFFDDRVTRVEVVYGASLCEGDAHDLTRYVAHLVAESLGPPTYRDGDHYAWMPPQGVYVAVHADGDAVHHWVTQQL